MSLSGLSAQREPRPHLLSLFDSVPKEGNPTMDFQLTPAQQQLQERARHFATQEVAPFSREADEMGIFPLHLVRRMGELGFLAAPVAPEYGGGGLDSVSYALL